MKELYDQKGGQTETNANSLMTFLVYATNMIAQQYSEQSRLALSRLKKSHLFPFHKPKECTKRNAYTTNRKDIIGKIYNHLCMKSVTRAGLMALRIWYKLHTIVK